MSLTLKYIDRKIHLFTRFFVNLQNSKNKISQKKAKKAFILFFKMDKKIIQKCYI